MKETTVVGSYQKNDFGLFDMHGNVYEWCEDVYESDYGKLPINGSANLSIGNPNLRVSRGGSWNYDSQSSRSANRSYNSSTDRVLGFGFRVAVRVK